MFPSSTTAAASLVASKRPRRVVRPCHAICYSRATGRPVHRSEPQTAKGRLGRSFRRPRHRVRFLNHGRLTTLAVEFKIGAMHGVAMHGLDGVSGKIEPTVKNIGTPKVTANRENPLARGSEGS